MNILIKLTSIVALIIAPHINVGDAPSSTHASVAHSGDAITVKRENYAINGGSLIVSKLTGLEVEMEVLETQLSGNAGGYVEGMMMLIDSKAFNETDFLDIAVNDNVVVKGNVLVPNDRGTYSGMVQVNVNGNVLQAKLDVSLTESGVYGSLILLTD